MRVVIYLILVNTTNTLSDESFMVVGLTILTERSHAHRGYLHTPSDQHRSRHNHSLGDFPSTPGA